MLPVESDLNTKKGITASELIAGGEDGGEQDLLPIEEGPIGGIKILDPPMPVVKADVCVLGGNLFIPQGQVAGFLAPDDDGGLRHPVLDGAILSGLNFKIDDGNF